MKALSGNPNLFAGADRPLSIPQRLLLLLPFLQWLPGITRESLQRDLMAGLTGAVVVLPQGVAFATIAGMPPQYGLYTAMITPIIAALFGSSRHLVSGPTTAISIVVFSSISQYATPGTPEFVQLVLTMTFLAGIYQLAFGVARLGVLVNFVSHTVVVAFTAAAAILIATSQIKHVLGLELARGHSFADTWLGVIQHYDQSNGYVLFIALATLAVALFSRRLSRKMPHLLLGLIVGSLTAFFLGADAHGVALVGSIPAQLPPLTSPLFNMDAIRMLAPQAFAVALLGLIEAVSIARSVATRSNQRIDGNQEFIGQGLSNIIGSFFSSYAGSGSFTRSGINYDSGAQTPMSAIFAAVILMAIVLLIAPLTAYLPVAAMGGVILLVAYNLVDFHHIRAIFNTSRPESAIFLVTFFSTLFLELEFAIYIGVLLSLVIFLAKTSKPKITLLAPDLTQKNRAFTDIETKPLQECGQLKVVRVDRSIYFGSVSYLQLKLQMISAAYGVKHILLIASRINYIDMAGAELLAQEARRLKANGGGLYVYGLKDELWQFLAEGGYLKMIGAQYFFDNKTDAISAIYRKLDQQACHQCSKPIFIECQREQPVTS
ncbi:SulP family inorganic anion transporter [Sedimenticola sp.]|uniref:SulP family inorganic anion transporter n=1 Tax=Sedimenticola sp. TaxID=1940285 RepID=UPI0025864526|nr:SulP family inorganic anion transporter [Sedimenticola sp.]MCW8902850.1 SulP family inorganic anion transporter [Sedimenticola sp.]